MATMQERIAKARADKAAAEALLTDADKAEQTDREELAKIEGERRAAERAARDLDLARRLDAAQDVNPRAKFRAIAIGEYPDTFIVIGNPAAHKKWEKDIGAAEKNSKIDKQACAVAYAVASVYDWNSKTDFSGSTTNGYELTKYLEANYGLVTPITNAAVELNGVHAEERKSSR